MPVDTRVRALLQAHGIAWSLVDGLGEQRVGTAMDALNPWLQQRARLMPARLA